MIFMSFFLSLLLDQRYSLPASLTQQRHEIIGGDCHFVLTIFSLNGKLYPLQ